VECFDYITKFYEHTEALNIMKVCLTITEYHRAGQIFFGSRSQVKNVGVRLKTNKRIEPENIVGIV
jgi:hypothetical protein